MRVVPNFNKPYFTIFTLLFTVEVLIALYVHDDFIRPYFGDVLVVILIYCFVLSFIKASKLKVAIAVLVFAFFIEFLQYLNFIQTIGLEKNKLALTVIGNSFALEDLLCYCIGFLMIFAFEKYFLKKSLEA